MFHVEPLTTHQEGQLHQLASLIAESPHNLVSGRDRQRVWDLHIQESVDVMHEIDPKNEKHWVDLGTGGGLPGLVAAILYPAVGWTLIDSTKKKIDAVEGFITELGLENARAIAGRAELLARDPQHRGLYDGVVSRAMARLDVVAELGRGFLRSGGVLVCIKGPKLTQERGYFQRAANRLGLHESSTVQVGSQDRDVRVVTLTASGAVPQAIPRANGVPQQSPIGGGK